MKAIRITALFLALAMLLALSGCSGGYTKQLFDEKSCGDVTEVRFQVWDVQSQQELTFTCYEPEKVAGIVEYLQGLRFRRIYTIAEGGSAFCLAGADEMWFVGSGDYICIGRRAYRAEPGTDISCAILEVMGLSDDYCPVCMSAPLE